MAVRFVARKCTQCAGKLQYIKEKKIWKCLYCGAEIEREEQYDGLFTIKNVVRQSLLDTAYRRLDSASKNVIECEKIDSRYVGTLIAKIAHEMITVITPGACSDRDAKNIFAQLKKNYELLKSQNPSITDDEEALYEFLEEADIYATLVLVFDSLNDTSRRDYVLSLLDAKGVYSKAANSNLLSYAIKNNHLDMGDDIISNANNVDEYISSSQDSKATKASVIVSSLNNGMRIGLETIIDNVMKSANKEQVDAVASAICKSKLSDEDVLRLVDFGFASGSPDIAISILECLKQSGQYLLIPAKFLISLLSMDAYSSEDKV